MECQGPSFFHNSVNLTLSGLEGVQTKQEISQLVDVNDLQLKGVGLFVRGESLHELQGALLLGFYNVDKAMTDTALKMKIF